MADGPSGPACLTHVRDARAKREKVSVPIGVCTQPPLSLFIRQVYVGGEFIGGCDTTVEMYKSGELRKMLVEAGAKTE